MSLSLLFVQYQTPRILAFPKDYSTTDVCTRIIWLHLSGVTDTFNKQHFNLFHFKLSAKSAVKCGSELHSELHINRH